MKRGFRFLMALFLFGGSLFGAGTGAMGIEPPPSPSVYLQRDYGYFLGDLVEVSYVVSLPLHEFLDTGSLPKRDEKLEGWAEVKETRVRAFSNGRRRVYLLTIACQIFRSVDGVHAKAIPPVKFLYGPKGNSSANASVLPATTPVMISPLTEEGAGFKPALTYSWSGSSRGVMRWIGIGLLLGCSVFLLSSVIRKKMLRVESPFTSGLRDLGRVKDPPAAMVVFRNALNKKAARAIFPHNLTAFFEAFPGARKYEKEVRDLVSLSDEISFNPESRGEDCDLVQRVSRVMRDLRRRERWE